jgi:hypothetical protein
MSDRLSRTGVAVRHDHEPHVRATRRCRKQGHTFRRHNHMRYMLLIYSDPSAWANLDAAQGEQMMKDYYAFTQRIVDTGELVAGDPLQGLDTATTIRVRDGKTTSTDGPFAETKEVLGGYYIVDVADLDRATALAAEIPDARWGSVEVRPIQELG